MKICAISHRIMSSSMSKLKQKKKPGLGLIINERKPASSDSFSITSGNTSADVVSITSSSNGRKLIRRDEVICSSGADKYTYDSERATEQPIYMSEYNDTEPLSGSSGVTSQSDTPVSDQASISGSGCSEDSTFSSRMKVKRKTFVHPGLEISRSVFRNGRFENPWPSYRFPSVPEMLRWTFGTKNNTNIPPKKELELSLPVLSLNRERLIKPPSNGVQVTWLGHASVLVQFDGVTILTDPIFSDRASPLQLIGPRRYRDPPCTIDELPKIDAVLISHNHYDHLDYNSVILLNQRFGSDIRWFVPLCLKSWMEDAGCTNVVELDWWEENCLEDHIDVSFIFTPSQHWSKRTPTDDNKTLWGSWTVIGPNHRFFYSGDSGYCPVFKQIGHMYGSFDLAALSIGAYEPRWFMRHNHLDPEDAVKIHQDLKVFKSVGVHWGTFAMANEYYLEPPRKLRESLDKHGISHDRFFTMKHGETRVVRRSNRKDSQ